MGIILSTKSFLKMVWSTQYEGIFSIRTVRGGDEVINSLWDQLIVNGKYQSGINFDTVFYNNRIKSNKAHN